MKQPPLTEVAASVASRTAGPAAVAGLATALVEALGPESVSTVEAVRRAASTDFAFLSPLLPAVLPDRCADVVVFPRTVDQITRVVALAHRYRVPVTPRGIGTGNYGQAVPLAAGLVVDLTRCDQVLGVGDGWIRAQAGATFVSLRAAARRHGQEIAMMPTTVGSTIGGFLSGGAGGIGSIEHGWLWDGFVHNLDVVTCPPGDDPLAVSGTDCLPYLHAYGVAGIIAAATVGLVPAREWLGVLASFPAGADTGQAGLAVLALEPAPRMVSLDEPDLVATYPADTAMPPGRQSLRVIADVSTASALRDAVTAHGGRVEDVRRAGTAYLESLSFGHVILRIRRARPGMCYVQVSGDALLTRTDEVKAALPGALLHLDGLRIANDASRPNHGRAFGGLLFSPFRDATTLYKGLTRLEEIGVNVVDPHTWLVGGPALPGIRAAAKRNDPDGLLNPGKLPPW